MPKKTQEKENAAGKRKKRGIRWGHIILFLIFIVLLATLIVGVMVAGYVFGLAKELPEITAYELEMNQSSFLYSKDGREIGYLHAGQDRVIVPISETPQILIDALLASEDTRFYEHLGVDMRSVARASVVVIRDSIKSRSLTFTQGASTLTMQLVRNVVADTEKSLDRKVKEALLALQFEKNYDKDEILFLYMNKIYLGKSTYGFGSAAEYYFGKNLKDISLAEAATMVGMLRNANYYAPYQHPDRVVDIRNTVLSTMITFDEDKYGVSARAAMKEPLKLSEAQENLGTDYDYPWFVDHVLNETATILTSLDLPQEIMFTGGLNIHTTLDIRIQEAMDDAYQDDSNFMESKTGDQVESGMAVIRPLTGEICGLVGGRVYGARRGFNRATAMQRQPGSTIKPVVAYGPAVELGYGPGTIIDDSPFTGSYNPHNSDRAYLGRITMRHALRLSRNVCAVKILQTIGTQKGWQFAIDMGLPLAESDAYNSAMALGGVARGVAPLDMAGAFSTFANSGVYTKPYCVARIVDAHGNTIYEAEPLQRRVFSEQTAWMVTDMLMSAVANGTGGNARLKDWPTAGKTGTVELPSAREDPDYAGKSGTKDVWFAGYTPELAGVVWMGYDNKKDADGNVQYMGRVFGGGAPAQLWKAVMTLCHEGLEVKQFPKPNGLVSVSIDMKSGMLPSELTPAEYYGSEIFNAKHVPTEKSDIWEVVEICADTNKLANDFCPNKTTAVRIRVENPEALSEKVPDYGLYTPIYYCPEHTTMQGDLSAVYICTDTRHGAERVLANVPYLGQSGGCPAELVAQRYYGPASLPTRYCALEGHGVKEADGATPFLPPDNSGGNEGDWLGIGGNTNTNPATNTNPGANTDINSGNNPGAGNSSNPGGDAVATNPADIKLYAPYNLAVNRSANGCLLSWAADNDPALATYRIQRITDNDEATEVRYSVNGYSFEDTVVEAGHVYTYSVYAYNIEYGVASSWSKSVSFSR